MAADNEMTIIIRARDQATAVLRTIGANVTKLFTAPIQFLGRQIGGVLKQMFSLRSLLIGGGAIALFSRGVTALSTNYQKYQAYFDTDTQANINATASAWSRLGATIQSIFGRFIGSSQFQESINSFSDFLRDHKDDIIGVMRSITEVLRLLASGLVSLPDLLGFAGTNMVGLPKFDPKVREDALERARQVDVAQRYSHILDAILKREKEAVNVLNDQEAIRLRMAEIMERLSTMYGSEGRGGQAFGPKIPDEVLRRMAVMSLLSDEFLKKWQGGKQITEELRIAMESAFGQGSDSSSGLRAMITIMERLGATTRDAGTEITQHLKAPLEDVSDTLRGLRDLWQESFRFDREALADLRNDLALIASIISNNITDALIGFIDGTKSAADAFKEMARSILADLGRMFIQIAIFRGIASLFGIPVQNTGFLGLNLSGGGRQSGGPVSAGTPYNVGERGPERFIPNKSGRISNRGGGGNVTVNNVFNGPANPQAIEKATMRAVMRGLETNVGFRKKLRAAT